MQLGRQHRIILLTLLEKICKEHIEELSDDLAERLITLGSSELTLTQEVEPEWQGAASTLLSTLGLRHAQLVMKELLNKFQPGSSPHFFVVKTLGQLATSNGNHSIFTTPLSCMCTYLFIVVFLVDSERGSAIVEHSAGKNDSNARSCQARQHAVGICLR